MRKIGLAVILLVGAFVFVFAQEKEKKDPLTLLTQLKPGEVPFLPPAVRDSLGAADTLFLDLQKGAKEGEWVLHFHVFNDESLFAFTFPIRHDSLMKFDSISLAGTRIDFFQTKLVNKSTKVANTVVVGLFSALSAGAPSMSPGNGLVMKMFFRAPASRPISIRSVATVSMQPNLEFVTPQGAPIYPAVVRLGDGGAAAPDKKPAKPSVPSKPKRKG
ncbi:MAG: hypothetical protein L0196_07720 [candidate division Zixibacteria bacterium]|nr:hypothetical protein [candidate division Zixibacteria bacterium]